MRGAFSPAYYTINFSPTELQRLVWLLESCTKDYDLTAEEEALIEQLSEILERTRG